ncbi:DgyrCDS12023 [Dimorphilus gyrociliatus]|uniref:DgyrCDS12023 n=1 Tax=Dimorphilus gyrociliatus TaxID=2664684 RepID=A0A7I8W723_9ANNE|nr:DgyrCDS12023 [Dimorphilus gyrociliatus]
MSVSVKRTSSGVASTLASLPKPKNGHSAYEAFSDFLDLDDHCIDKEDEHTPPSLSSKNSNRRHSMKKTHAPEPPEEKIDPSTLPSENQIKERLNDWFDALAPVSESEKNHINKLDKTDQWRYILKQIRLTKKCSSSLYLINLKQKREILSTLRNLKRHLLVNDESLLNELEKGNIIVHVVSVLSDGVKSLVNKPLSLFQRDSYHFIIHDSLVCINFFCRKNLSFTLSDSTEFYESVIYCLNDSFGRKITTIALEVLQLAIRNHQGFGNLISSLSKRKKTSERYSLFGPIVNIQRWEYITERTALALIRLVNTMIKHTRDNEEQIWFQYELVSAGFHANKLDLLESSDDLRDSLNEYHKNLIDVDSFKSDSSHELQLLREENKKLLKQLAESAKFKTEEKHTTACLLKVEKEVKTEKKNNRTDSIPIAPPINLGIINQSSEKRELCIDTLKIKPKERMPLYNWTPIRDLEGTIFENLNHNDKSILDNIDFEDFERQFCTSSPVGSQRFKRMIDKSSSTFFFVETNRSKNIIITRKRINLTAVEIRDAIENLKIDLILSDVAEILIKFIPTDQELEDLAKSVSKRSHYGEAEEFIYQLSQIERLANKLETIYFLNQFDDSIGRLSPVIGSITKASLSLIDNRRFFAFLKIVLYIGNFTNYGKKQYTFGYRINSLSKLAEVKSNDKKQNLLQYVLGVIHDKFPELVTFHETLTFKVEKGVSYKSIKLEIDNLEKKHSIACEETKSCVNKKNLEKLLQQSNSSLEEIQKSFRTMTEKWNLVCSLYGETPDVTEPYDFFKTISEFIQLYKETERKLFQKPFIVSDKSLKTTSSIEIRSSKSSFTQQAKDLHDAFVEQMKKRKNSVKNDKSVEEALNVLDDAIDSHSQLTLRTSSEILDESHL